MYDPEEILKKLRDEIGRVVVGQQGLVEGLLIGLLSDGHVLVEGAPGLAKTTAIRTLAQTLGLPFGRVQFTPDLLPGDLTGNPVFVPGSGEYQLRRGPIFTSLLLADEINRAPAKVQSALLEAMQERQVTIGDETLPLPRPFLVMATQNPVELEGTYPLPEAQVDRFLLKVLVPYPSEAEERTIVSRSAGPPPEVERVIEADGVAALREHAENVHVADEIRDYAVRLVRGTREPGALSEIALRDKVLTARADDARVLGLLRSEPVTLGASPRASIFLVRAARARALLDGRRFTTPHDVKSVAKAVLRHRVAVSYEAEAEGIDSDAVVDAVLAAVATP